MGRYDYDWPPYVPVAERKRKAALHVEKLKKKGKNVNPVVIEGRQMAKTFWGKAWCDNLEAYSDFENRLPRGRTYARNGSVIDLQISKGKVNAQVMGSSLYRVTITVKPVPKTHWKALIKACAGKIDSLIELLQGKFSKAVMEKITQKEKGLFPKPSDISLACTCPDGASMCKHVAATLYGIGATLDHKPWWLFELRHVDQTELIGTISANEILAKSDKNEIESDELASLFGIELAAEEAAPVKKTRLKKKKTE